jgi:hypothetical protein
MLDVEQWAEIRRMHKVDGLSIREIARRTGRDRNTVRAALRSDVPPRYRRGPRPSELDPFKAQIHELLEGDAELPGKRVREEIEEEGYGGGKTILDDYLREVRPRSEPDRVSRKARRPERGKSKLVTEQSRRLRVEHAPCGRAGQSSLRVDARLAAAAERRHPWSSTSRRGRPGP